MPVQLPEMNILDLPVDIEVQILSELPKKEIQRARQVCTHFRDLVDEPSLKTLIVKPGIERSQDRIRDERESVYNQKW